MPDDIVSSWLLRKLSRKVLYYEQDLTSEVINYTKPLFCYYVGIKYEPKRGLLIVAPPKRD